MSVKRYKLLLGDHIGNDADGREVIYRPGMIIETDYDMLSYNGGGGKQPKFELIDDTDGMHSENQTLRDENEALKARLAELEANLVPA